MSGYLSRSKSTPTNLSSSTIAAYVSNHFYDAASAQLLPFQMLFKWVVDSFRSFIQHWQLELCDAFNYSKAHTDIPVHRWKEWDEMGDIYEIPNGC